MALLHYRLVDKLGEGGMGAVWRATDEKLGREVALKVLPEAFADDAERRARFEREAKLLASLSHPNIAHIYGLENAQVREDGKRATGDDDIASADGTAKRSPSPLPSPVSPLTFIVMELVNGEGLDQRIGRGPLALSEALPIALQIAEGLEAAH